MFPSAGAKAPEPGQLFREPDLAVTLRKLVEAEKQALAAGKDRRAAILSAFDRFYKRDIAPTWSTTSSRARESVTTCSAVRSLP